MAKVRSKKHMYWHTPAKILLEHGMKPAMVAKALKIAYPQGEITGRHVGGYSRRLKNDNMLEINLPQTIDIQDAYAMIEGMITDDDRFVYKCAVGSAKRTLKCFEYKMIAEAMQPEEDIEKWLLNTNHTTPI